MRVTIFMISVRECKWEHFVHWCQNARNVFFFFQDIKTKKKKTHSIWNISIYCVHNAFKVFNSAGRFLCHMLILLNFQMTGVLNHDRVELKWMDAAVLVTRHYLWHVIPGWMNWKGDGGGDKCELFPRFFFLPWFLKGWVLRSHPSLTFLPHPASPEKKKQKTTDGGGWGKKWSQLYNNPALPAAPSSHHLLSTTTSGSTCAAKPSLGTPAPVCRHVGRWQWRDGEQTSR